MGKGDNPRSWVATEDGAPLVTAVSIEPDPPPELERATGARSSSSACPFSR